MGINIYPIPLGFDCSYIIKDRSVVLVDGGAPKKAKGFMKGLEKVSIKPEEVKLIILTHGHFSNCAGFDLI
ncbi:MAG: MBL fold metallo-hydrolase [Candidatus Aminicenantes bacterium]|nr:MAG: MBL fold metallo-hydrolase [Candidatus Aminicenantes bacterium]